MALTLFRLIAAFRHRNPNFLNPKPLNPFLSSKTRIYHSKSLVSRRSTAGFTLRRSSSPPSAEKSDLLFLLSCVCVLGRNLVVTTTDERLGPADAGENGASVGWGTIAAIVTSMGGGPAAVGIVRLSGPTAVDVAARVFLPARRSKEGARVLLWKPRSHFVEYGFALDRKGKVIDEVLAVPMLAPRSYTKEDVVELQCHGSDVCLNRVLRACLEAGARLAEPGWTLTLTRFYFCLLFLSFLVL